jgi:hypothetical protein
MWYSGQGAAAETPQTLLKGELEYELLKENSF